MYKQARFMRPNATLAPNVSAAVRLNWPLLVMLVLMFGK